MRLLDPLRLLLVAGCCAGVAQAQLQMPPAETVQCVFGGAPQAVSVVFRNPETNTCAMKLRTQLNQVSSATVLPVGQPQDWNLNLKFPPKAKCAA